MPKILDCTLRDGGYYNDWNFPVDTATSTVKSLHQAGVDVIELGLKSATDDKCSGLFKYCNEDYLSALDLPPDGTYSFMLNVKEFIKDGQINHEALNQMIRPASASVFQMCRLATHYADFTFIKEFFDYFTKNGYRVGINLMGVSLLEEEQLQQAMVVVDQLKPEVFYIADSFGSMLPDDISGLVEIIRQHYAGPLGIHTHDNQGLAFANSLRAIDLGVEYIDATLTGMGRGAGNLSTEQILLWLQNRGQDKARYHSGRVLDIIQDYFAPLKSQYGWGFNYVYMLSGLNNIHPVYCMALCEGNKFSTSQISGMLESIPKDKRASFNRESLKSAINTNLASVAGDSGSASKIPHFDKAGFQMESESCLIVSTGPDVKQYAQPIAQLVARNQWAVLECNDTGAVDHIEKRQTIILNGMRLQEALQRNPHQLHTILTGEESVENYTGQHSFFGNIYHWPYVVGPLEFHQNYIAIPEYEAGQYAISLAISLGYRQLYLAGFSGYAEPTRNQAMEHYFDDLLRAVEEVSITAITPTAYRNLSLRSIFTL